MTIEEVESPNLDSVYIGTHSFGLTFKHQLRQILLYLLPQSGHPTVDTNIILPSNPVIDIKVAARNFVDKGMIAKMTLDELFIRYNLGFTTSKNEWQKVIKLKSINQEASKEKNGGVSFDEDKNMIVKNSSPLTLSWALQLRNALFYGFDDPSLKAQKLSVTIPQVIYTNLPDRLEDLVRLFALNEIHCEIIETPVVYVKEKEN